MAEPSPRADAAGGIALLKMLDLEKESITTAELKVNYLNPQPPTRRKWWQGRAVKGKMLGVTGGNCGLREPR